MPTTILLIRHAIVENPQNILYGRLPGFALSSEGERQAETLGRYLEVLPLAAVYCSPLERARQTAAAIATRQAGMTPRRSHLLNEALTPHQGKKVTGLYGLSFYEPTAGEDTMQGIARRMERFMQRTVHRFPERIVAAVSHGDPISIYLMHLLGHELTEKALRSSHATFPHRASINRLMFGNDGRLIDRHYETYTTIANSLSAVAR